MRVKREYGLPWWRQRLGVAALVAESRAAPVEEYSVVGIDASVVSALHEGEAPNVMQQCIKRQQQE